MPLYQFSRDGEKEVKPCAEAWLTERAGDAILDQGLMAVLSIKGQDAVRLAKMQSISSQSKALALR
jgi:type VI secretion system protein ImpC